MADILIKGLKMPNSCQTCVYELGYNIPMCPDDAILENYLEDERLGRHPSCPLVALPEHGRLGDLDKVANRMHRYAMACRKNGDPERAELWMYAEEEVRLQGTVVEANTEEKEK